MKPLAIDLFCGLGGWTEGLLAEGYEVVGYDIEAHEYGDMRYPAAGRPKTRAALTPARDGRLMVVKKLRN